MCFRSYGHEAVYSNCVLVAEIGMGFTELLRAVTKSFIGASFVARRKPRRRGWSSRVLCLFLVLFFSIYIVHEASADVDWQLTSSCCCLTTRDLLLSIPRWNWFWGELVCCHATVVLERSVVFCAMIGSVSRAVQTLLDGTRQCLFYVDAVGEIHGLLTAHASICMRNLDTCLLNIVSLAVYMIVYRPMRCRNGCVSETDPACLQFLQLSLEFDTLVFSEFR